MPKGTVLHMAATSDWDGNEVLFVHMSTGELWKYAAQYDKDNEFTEFVWEKIN